MGRYRVSVVPSSFIMNMVTITKLVVVIPGILILPQDHNVLGKCGEWLGFMCVLCCSIDI